MTDGIRLDHISRHYDLGKHTIQALSDISYFIERGSFTVIVGKSGCGKTTILRILAGLETPDTGSIFFYRAGKTVDRDTFGLGIVFQEPRLMPWLTVEQNLTFGIRGKLPASEVTSRGDHLLDLLGLTRFREAYPQQISGGMAQRTALGRTLAFDPDVVLMDEPFGALDYFTRKALQQEIVKLHLATGKTFVFVTHDVEEALALGQNVLVMEKGRLAERLEIPFPRPRDTGETHFQPFRKRILSSISGTG